MFLPSGQFSSSLNSVKVMKIKKYSVVRKNPVDTYGSSTGHPPIHVNKIAVIAKAQMKCFISWLQEAPVNFGM